MIEGFQIRAARGHLDWSRDDLADKAVISPETVKNFETGKFRPEPETIAKITEVLKRQGIEFIDGGVRKVERMQGHNSNLIALSAEFHTHPKYSDFYKHYGKRLGGFCGIYDLVENMGNALTKFENSTIDPWESIDWVQLTEDFPHMIITEMLQEDDPYFMPDMGETLMLAIKKQGAKP